MKKVLALGLALMALGAPTGASAGISTETRQFVYANGLKPNTAYSIEFYSHDSPTDQYPYAYGYSGFGSNAYGQFKASVLLSDLADPFYASPIYSVQACLLEQPAYNEVGCTPTEYVGYVPLSLWTYHG